jgi:hypothetical protein
LEYLSVELRKKVGPRAQPRGSDVRLLGKPASTAQPPDLGPRPDREEEPPWQQAVSPWPDHA